VIPLTDDIRNVDVGVPGAHQKENAALAVHLAKTFVSIKEPVLWADNVGNLPQAVIAGLSRAKWPGRCQKVHDPSHPTLTWFLDGAHTEESLQCCMEWFASPEASLKGESKPIDRTLVFNCTKGRSVTAFLQAMMNTLHTQIRTYGLQNQLKDSFFQRVIFCTNTTYTDGGFKKDLLSVNLSAENSNLKVQNDLAASWIKLFPDYPQDRLHRLPSIEHAVQMIRSQKSLLENHVLVTGSLHLVGGAIEAASLASAVFQ